jgi:unsaturated chondroitin disaccharide hydrolase
VYGEDGGSSTIKTMAENFTFGVRNNTNNASDDHDVGFRTMSSYGMGAQMIGGNNVYTYQGVTDLSYNQQIEAAADFLANRYVPAVGATRSWNSVSTQTEVIADNMMNIQILFQAAAIGDTTTVDGLTETQIAINHAETTFRDFVRPDGSSVHEVVYNTSTGAVMYKQSVQGITSFGQWNPALPASGQPYATEGCWSRGESWLVQGFTMMYQNTKMPEFLSDAEVVANYWVKRTLTNVAAGASYIPPTDFDVALVGVADDVNHQDSSAGAIAAGGLMELASVEPDPTLRAQYWSVAVNTLDDLLSTTYFSTDPTYGALLMHGANEFSVAGENSSLVYGDYYLLQDLTEYQTLAPSFAGTTTPEPASLGLVGVPVVLGLLRRRRR